MAEIIPFNETNTPKIIDRFKASKLIAFPTDTVFGLGVSIEKLTAVRRFYQVKHRDFSQPSQLLIGSTEPLARYAIEISSQAELLIKRFWPGPLTIIFFASLEVPHYLTKDGRVAIRLPRYELLEKVISDLGHALVSSSCNIEGEAPATSFEAITPELLKNIDVVLDGKVVLGKESTIVDSTGPKPEILREGAISREQLTNNN